MLRIRIPHIILSTLTLMFGGTHVAAGQDSRAALIAAAQAEKARSRAPYVPGRAERTIVTLRRELLQDPNGLYPLFGSVYSGGGFTVGAGYRRFYSDRTFADLKGMYSIEGYKLFEGSTDSLGHFGQRLDLHGRVGWRDATQVAFNGLGMNSPEDGTNFRMKQAYAGGDVSARPVPYVVLGAGLSFEDFTMQQGTGSTPSIEAEHTPASAPGLGDSPSFFHTTATGGIDTRPSPGYSRRGGLYAVTYHNYADRNNTYSFDRLDAEIVQHMPILRETWVVSVHGLLQTTLDDDDAVPYFLLPSLGSGSTLRGYSSWRFRDRTSLLMSGEFRWIPNRLGLDMAIFYDTGKVTPRFHDLSFRGLASDVGVGIRLHGPFTTPLRIELARGREGMHLVFAGSAAF